MALLQFRPEGIYCPAGDFYIDPWRPVQRAVITHAHSDHSRWGMQHYLAHPLSIPVMRLRLGAGIAVHGLPYGESLSINGVKVSLHPAGHIAGSAQVRVEHHGEVWVAAGDYKVEDDGLATAFEPVACHTFISESTFGLPVFRWQPQHQVFAEINAWWAANAATGVCSVLAAYALGKAQRLLQGLDHSIGPVLCHGAVHATNEALAGAGLNLKNCEKVSANARKEDFRQALVLCPPSALGTSWLRKMEPTSTAMASGWMAMRGTRRRRAAHRGFVLSDHADWPGLLQAVQATGAQQVIATHGYTAAFSLHLQQLGLQASEGSTEYGSEEANDIEVTSPEVSA